MKIIFLIFIFYSFATLASEQISECQIDLFAKIYRLSGGRFLSSREVINNSNCPPAINSKMVETIADAEGSISTDFLKAELAKDFSGIAINFSSKKISLLNLENVLKERILANTNLYFLQTRSLNAISGIGLKSEEELSIVCDNCQSSGEKNLKIDIINSNANTTRALWFSTKIVAKIKVVKAKRNISFQQKNLNPEDLYYDEIMTSMPENALTSLENIRFFKNNKTLLQDAVISNSDLQPVNLINFGTPVSVSLVGANISLQKMAMPTRSAHFGETIELKGPNSKNISGKVVDYNKVVIEL